MIILVGLTALVLGLSLFSWRHPDGTRQFEFAFGILPPAGVRDIIAYRRCPGGPGDRFVLLRFTANRAAIDETIAFRPLERDLNAVDDRLRTHNDVPRFWRSIFSNYFDYGGTEWRIPTELISPEVYEWHGSHSKLTRVKLLWDAHTGKAFALSTIG